MTDLNILYDKITSDRSSDLEVSYKELSDEYAFTPYIEDKPKMINIERL